MERRPTEELKAMVLAILKERGLNSKKETLERIFPNPEDLHQFSDEQILKVAADPEHPFCIAICSGKEWYSCYRVRPNGKWLNITPEQYAQLQKHRPLSHTWCPDCYEKIMDDPEVLG